jgi:hypothetical protein
MENIKEPLCPVHKIKMIRKKETFMRDFYKCPLCSYHVYIDKIKLRID